MGQTPSLPNVSVIIVNWNSHEFLRQCLRTVFQYAGDLRIEIIVIDNASYDGSEPMVRSEFPKVIFIQGDENVGFARANNAAAMQANGRNLLFLNPDTEVSDGTIETMVRFIDATPEAGAVGCRLLNTDGSLQTSCIQPFPTILNQILDAEALRRLLPESPLWGTRAFLRDPAIPAEVEAISGACLLVRRDTFLEVGRFTEAYFMYAEDIDLCFKLKGAGKHNYYLGNVSVVHHGGQSSNASTESQFGNVMMRESIAKFLRLHRGARYALAYRVALAFTALARLGVLGLTRLLGLGLYKPKVIGNGLRKWNSVLRWAVGAETWVHNFGAESS